MSRITVSFVALCVGACFSSGDLLAVDFQEGWHLLEGTSSSSITLVDIDQDTDLDAYVTDQNGSDRLWINDGTGQYTLSPQILDPGVGSGSAFGLLNGDAFPDMFLSRHLSSNVVWLNDGTGTLVDSGQSLGGNVSRGNVALGYLDGDATLDAFALTNGGGNSVYFNDGSGIFTDSLQALGTGQSVDVVLVDVGEDANGDIDAVVANNGLNQVWFNDGNGGFTDSGENLSSYSSFGVGVGLINNDAIVDIFFANGNNSGAANTVFFGDGDGTFTKTAQSLGNNYSVSVLLYDFDGQNGPDVFVGNNSGVMDRLWLNDGSGTYTDAGLTLGFGAAFGTDMGFINNDAHMDIFIANLYQPDQVWFGDGAGGFTNSGQALGSLQAQGMAIGDIDGDNDVDVVIGATGGTARVLVNDGDGNFTDTNQWLVTGLGNNVDSIELADFDGINGLDIFIAVSPQGGAGNYANRVFFNNGSGVFTDSGQTLGSYNSGAIAVGDVDGDDDLDVFVGNAPYNADTGVNNLWLNSGGSFTLDGQSLGESNTRAAKLVDLDDDDDLDLFIGNVGFGGSSESNLVFLNGQGLDSEGTFSDSGQALGSGTTFDVAFGFLNDDNHIDMFVGNEGANKVWFNDGTGMFSDSGQSLGNGKTHGVHLFDADDDGDLDVFVTNGGSSSQPNRVWLNDGDGNFVDSGLVLGSSDSDSSGMADLNGDLLEDVYVSNRSGDLRVWLNNTVIVRQQEITPMPAAQEAPIGDPVSIEVVYTTSDDAASVSGLGLRMHWNSSELTFVNLSDLWTGDLDSSDTACQADGVDFDSDPETDCYVEVVWSDGGDDFPGTGNLPTSLFDANFTANVPFAQTTFVKFSASSLAPTYTLNANAATVTNPDSGQPEFDPTPGPGATLPFGNVSTQGSSDPQVVDIINSGTGPLTLDCTLSGTNSGDFDVDVCPSPIAAGGSTQVKVLCQPLTSGNRVASLNIATNDTDEANVSYSLTCNGVDIPEFDSIPVAGSELAFGSVDTETDSSLVLLNVINRGRAPLTLSCSLSGVDSSQFNIDECPTPVGTIDPVDVSISCHPTSTGQKSASLDISTNDSDESPVSWLLSCNGQVPETETVFEDGFEASGM